MANCKGSVGSQFWRGVIKLKEKFFWGSVFMVNNGKKTKFWENIWINDYKLCDKFPRLYASCENKEILVGDCWDNGN